MKKLLSLVMTCILICGLFVPGAYAKKKDSLVSGLYHYVLNEDGTAEITDVDESITDGNIPSELDGHKVTVIGASAFSLCGKLVKAVIPEGVQKPVIVILSFVRPLFCAAWHCPGSAVESLQMIRSISGLASRTDSPTVTDSCESWFE